MLKVAIILVISCVTADVAAANGNGAGAGGAGHQRAINSGLPPGEPGPVGAPNNRRQPAPAPTSDHGTSPPEDGPPNYP